MTTIKATVTDRRIELDAPEDWPDGIEVEIHPLKSEVEGRMPPEEISRLLSAMDQFEPLEFTDAERAAWEAQRQARKDSEQARFAELAGKLQGMWE